MREWKERRNAALGRVPKAAFWLGRDGVGAK
jgi:hypothetical protein